MKTLVEIKIFEEAKKIQINAVEFGEHGQVYFLAEPQHVDFFTTVKFNQAADNHKLYIDRGLLFYNAADAILYSKSFISRIK